MTDRRDREPTEAELARQKAEQELRKIKAETPVYRAMHDRLRQIRSANHIGESLAATFRGERR